jgi:hypothetical protein
MLLALILGFRDILTVIITVLVTTHFSTYLFHGRAESVTICDNIGLSSSKHSAERNYVHINLQITK